MTQQRLGIIMNGVTGRMGMNQHLIRSIVAIRAQGGVALRNGDTVMPDPILVGRNEAKVAQLAKANGVTRWTTDLNAALKNPEDTLFFDAATTKLRAKLLRKAIAAGTMADVPIIAQLIRDLAEYEKLSADCIEIARCYRWEEIAENTIRHYRVALDSLGQLFTGPRRE